MLNLTTEQLDKMLIESGEKIENLRLGLNAVGSEIGQINRKKDGIEKDLKVQENKSRAISKALILVRGVPLKIPQMRNRLLRRMERAGREDITISESKNLRTEIETLKLELQKACPHPFVYREQGYEGSPSQDRDNRRPEYRYCIVCGLNERGKSSGQYDYIGTCFEKLADADNRIVRDEPWTPEGRKRVNIWIPLGAVLKPFEDLVVKVLNS